MKFKNGNKILLILDVDETLVHATDQQLGVEADFILFNYYVYKRPYLDKFLEDIKDDFLVGIWSSASDDYVAAIVEKIIPKEIGLAFVWGRSRCTYRRNFQIDDRGYYDADPNNHYHYIKPLKKLKRQGYDLNRILVTT